LDHYHPNNPLAHSETGPLPSTAWRLSSDTPPPHPRLLEPNLYLYKYLSNLVPLILLVHVTYEDGTDRVLQNVSTYSSDARESPKRKNIIFTTWQKFEMKKIPCACCWKKFL
jgi:hypothetical protein